MNQTKQIYPFYFIATLRQAVPTSWDCARQEKSLKIEIKDEDISRLGIGLSTEDLKSIKLIRHYGLPFGAIMLLTPS